MIPASLGATALFIDDVQTSKGSILVNGPVDQPWGVRAAIFPDPSGHLWEVAAPSG